MKKIDFKKFQKRIDMNKRNYSRVIVIFKLTA